MIVRNPGSSSEWGDTPDTFTDTDTGQLVAADRLVFVNGEYRYLNIAANVAVEPAKVVNWTNAAGVLNPEPGLGTINDHSGYFADLGGARPVYLKYALLKTAGLGDPIIIPWENSGTDSQAPSSGVVYTPNSRMPPVWDKPESFLTPFIGTLADLGPFLAATSLGGGLASLFSGGSFTAGAGGLLGDLANGGTVIDLVASAPVWTAAEEAAMLGGGLDALVPVVPALGTLPPGVPMWTAAEEAAMLGGGVDALAPVAPVLATPVAPLGELEALDQATSSVWPSPAGVAPFLPAAAALPGIETLLSTVAKALTAAAGGLLSGVKAARPVAPVLPDSAAPQLGQSLLLLGAGALGVLLLVLAVKK